MNHRCLPRGAVMALLCLVSLTPHALAGSPSDLDDVPDPDRPLGDLPTHELPVQDLVPAFGPLLAAPPSGRTSLSLSLSLFDSDHRVSLSGGLLLSIPLDIVAPSKAKRPGPRPSPDDDEALEAKSSEDDDDASSESTHANAEKRRNKTKGRRPKRGGGGDELDATGPKLPVVRPKDARAAIAATQRRRGTVTTLDELDGMATRARFSSLLPTVRLRATRLVDESVSLSPTSYDAERTTSRGGASLWLEARATWELDRLVFATEEVRVAQIQHSVAKDHEGDARRVVEHLFAWQRAVYAMFDPSLSLTSCVQAWLDTEQLAATLDVETGGWFSRWGAHHHVPRPSCVTAYEADVAVD